MVEARILFLFGPTRPDGLDLADADDRALLVEAATDSELSPAQLAAREVLAGQIMSDDPGGVGHRPAAPRRWP